MILHNHLIFRIAFGYTAEDFRNVYISQSLEPIINVPQSVIQSYTRIQFPIIQNSFLFFFITKNNFKRINRENGAIPNESSFDGK